MKNIYTYVFGIIFASIIILAPAFAQQQAPICLNSSGHLIWEAPQTSNYIPYLKSTNSVSNSPFKVSGQYIRVPEGMEIVRRDTTGGYAQGIFFLDKNATTRESGVGFYGSGNNVPDTIFLGFGTSPWSSTNGLFIKNTGNVGIGTIVPSEKLNVVGNIKATGDICTATKCLNSVTGGSGGGIGGTGTANYISKFTNSTTLNNSSIFESTAGNIGIGTTAPLSKLEIAGNIKASGDIAGTRLCIGNDCRASWGGTGSPEQSGWALNASSNTIGTINSVTNPKIQIKNGTNLILEISEE